jgi:rhamnose transport system ATP-binding protein
VEQCLVEVRGIKKYFPGIKALDGVDFKIRAGEVHALIGENGAGKSTLVKLLTGVYQPTDGKILLKGKEVGFASPHTSQRAGIAAIHQEVTVFPELTVTENVFMGHHIKKPMGLIDWGQMREKTGALLEKLEVGIDPDARVKNLSVAERHLVEIIKALSFDVDVVIMDEPTSALSLEEVKDLYQIIRQLKKEGKAVIFISHKLDEVYEIADYFTVLRDGKYIGEGLVKEAGVDKIIAMMVGRSLSQIFPKVDVEQGPTIFRVKNLSKTGLFKDITFELHEGEILGFFGLVGSGRSEVMQVIFGIDQLSEGEIFINGEKVLIRNPTKALDKGLSYIPEDRQQQGAILKMNIRENVTLPIVNELSHARKFLNKKGELKVTQEYGSRLDIKASSWEQLVETLSGGNQQKVVLAKWLATKPKILILDEPTKGIDVPTKAAVHKFMGELAKQRLGMIMISSELPEILGMSDNIVVMHEGCIAARFTREEASAEKIIKAATGHI